MLTLTKNATNVVKSLTERPDTNGLRISGRAAGSKGDAQAPGYSVAVADGPQTNDQVVEQDGATVYLDQQAANELSNQVLDAGTDPRGNLQFALSPQD